MMKILATKFQLRVWNKLKKILRGKTVAYKFIEKEIWKIQVYSVSANTCPKNSLSQITSCNSIKRKNGKNGQYFKKKNLIEKKSLLKKESS